MKWKITFIKSIKYSFSKILDERRIMNLLSNSSFTVNDDLKKNELIDDYLLTVEFIHSKLLDIAKKLG